jgi:hypothetical protein
MTHFPDATKHIDVRFHYVCDLIEQKRIDIIWVPTDENSADMFTKNLGHIKFEKFRSMLSPAGLRSYLGLQKSELEFQLISSNIFIHFF